MARELTLDQLSATVLPFGKFKGKTFDQTDLHYLDWLIGQDFLRDPLKARLAAYLSHPTIKREVERLGIGREE